MGIPLDEMVIWNPDLEQGGLTREQIAKAKIILWYGFCSVHQMFQPKDIIKFRNQHPDGLVTSFTECSFEVCKQSDYIGNTEDHPADREGRAAQYALAGRHRVEPGRAPGAGSHLRGQDRAVHGLNHLHVLDHAAQVIRSTWRGLSKTWSTARWSTRSACRNTRRSWRRFRWNGCFSFPDRRSGSADFFAVGQCEAFPTASCLCLSFSRTQNPLHGFGSLA